MILIVFEIKYHTDIGNGVINVLNVTSTWYIIVCKKKNYIENPIGKAYYCFYRKFHLFLLKIYRVIMSTRQNINVTI